MRLSPLTIATLLLIACGGGSATPQEPPKAAAEASAAPAPSAGPWLAFMTPSRPAGSSVEVGAVTVRRGPDGCAFDVRASDGAKKSAPACDPKHLRDDVAKAACALDGDVVWLTHQDTPESAEVVELTVARYDHPDAAADLRLICAPFATFKNPSTGKALDSPSLDDSQRSRLRAAVLEETLTSRQWRVWLRGFPENRAAAVATLRDAAKAANVPWRDRVDGQVTAPR